MKRYLPIVFILLWACDNISNTTSEAPIARVNDSYLYKSDMAGLVPLHASSRDSLIIIQNYIDNWIQHQVIIQKAEQNLTLEEQAFEKQLQEYRNSLVIYAYETKLINQNLDTAVSNFQIEDYYNKFKHSFILTENIIKYNFVKLHIDSARVDRFRSLIRSDKMDDLNELEDLCKQYAAYYWLEDSWVSFARILDQVPYPVDNQERFLTRNRRIEHREDPYWYFVTIKEYLLKDSISPLPFEQDNIRNIIVNNRKLELVRNMKKDLLEKAINNQEVEVFP